MACCLASSREKTTILAGWPISPLSRRRTSTWPSEPVPPVISTRLPLSGYMGQPPLVVGGRVCSQFGYHLRPGGDAVAGRAHEALGAEAAVARRVVVRVDLDVEMHGFLHLCEQSVLSNRRAGDLHEPAEAGLLREKVPDDTSQDLRRKAAVDGVLVAAHALAALAQEPLEERILLEEVAPEDGRADREATGPVDLAEELAASVEVLGVGQVVLGVGALAPAEHAVGAHMDEAGAGGLAEPGQTVREQRVEADGEDRVGRLLHLLDDADAVDDGIRPGFGHGSLDGGEVERVDARQQAPGRHVGVLGELAPDAARVEEGGVDLEPPPEHLEGLVAQHALAAEDEHFHRPRPPR